MRVGFNEGPPFLLTKTKTTTMKANEAKIESIVAPVLETMGYEPVRIRFISAPGPTLQIMAERASDGHLDIEDCEKISRALSPVLDAEDPIQGAYSLEVSSPGIDRPLTRLKDFDRYAGFEARIELEDPIDGQKRYKGKLAGVKDETITLETDKGPKALPFAAIESAKLVLTDELIAATQEKRI